MLAGPALAFLYAVPAILYPRPIWSTWDDHILGRSGDPVLDLYLLKWGVHQLALGMPGFWAGAGPSAKTWVLRSA